VRLQGKKALVTGGSRGIGRAISLTFGREGADVAVNFRRNQEKALEVVEEIQSMGQDAIEVRADVSVKSDVLGMVDTVIKRFGRIDILVNNAGIGRGVPIIDMTEEDWDAVLDVDLKGVFLCTQAVAKEMMKQGGGKIINIASLAAVGAVGNSAQYAAAKAGVLQFTKVTAYELGKFKINVNSICPGLIETDMIYSGGRSKEEIERNTARSKSSVLGRLGQPQDIANMALFLASEEADFITARNFIVDGGRFNLFGQI
jgi:3-oxoacyl-[acyl-carrier protein] reductase